MKRDAVALWWYDRTRHLTSGFAIPGVAALSRHVGRPAEDTVFGFGAHFGPEIALRRAVTEMGRLLPAVADVCADGTGHRCGTPH